MSEYAYKCDAPESSCIRTSTSSNLTGIPSVGCYHSVIFLHLLYQVAFEGWTVISL